MKENSRQKVKLSQHTVPLWSRHSKCLSTALKRMTRFCQDSFLTHLVFIWKW